MKQLIKMQSLFLLLAVFWGMEAMAADPGIKSAKHKRVAVQRGWYIRLQAETATLSDDKTVFGYLKGASDGKDRYDAEALSGGGLYTAIYHDDFPKSDEYRSDYRAFRKLGEKSDTWVIKVKSRDANADVTLRWDGVTWVRKNAQGDFVEKHWPGRRVLRRMRLIDEANGKIINVRRRHSYTFNMNGSREHELKWVLLKKGEEVSRPAKMPETQAAHRKAVAKAVSKDDPLLPDAKKVYKKKKVKSHSSEDFENTNENPL